jgi:hypothetical protein
MSRSADLDAALRSSVEALASGAAPIASDLGNP